jgi:hypothetical protein
LLSLQGSDLSKHGDGLYEAMTVKDIKERLYYTFDEPPESYEAFVEWFEQVIVWLLLPVQVLFNTFMLAPL